VVGGEIHVNNDLYIVDLPAVGEGHQYLDLTGNTGHNKGVLSNPIATVPGLHYELSFDLGAFLYGGSFGDAAVDLSFNGTPAGTFVNVNSLVQNGTDWERISISWPRRRQPQSSSWGDEHGPDPRVGTPA
jgi:hypothetical protein